MSSPYLNNLIIIGCILTYTSVILLGVDSSLTGEDNFHYICAVSTVQWLIFADVLIVDSHMDHEL